MAYDNREYWSSLHDAERGDLTAVGYAALGKGFNREAYRLRLDAVRRIFLRAGISPRSLLEGAVGVGAYASLWRAVGVNRWVGVDISETAVADLRVRHPESAFHALDLAHPSEAGLARLGGPFDVVTAIDVLYHLVDDAMFEPALRTLAEQVRPGGHLLLSDVFTDSPRGIAAHVRRRPLRAYLAILEPLGFALAEREPVFAILGDPVPRSGLHPVDQGLFLAWRILQKAVRSTPGPLRDAVGSYAARALAPVDNLLRRTNVTQGVNLELALFKRRG